MNDILVVGQGKGLWVAGGGQEKVAKYRGKRQSLFKYRINDALAVRDNIYVGGIYMENKNTMVGGYALSEVYTMTHTGCNHKCAQPKG